MERLVGKLLVVLTLLTLSLEAADTATRDWGVYLGGKQRNLYSPLDQIHKANVDRLKVAWTYDTGDRGEYQANNLIVQGVLYTATPTRKLVALDAATGEEIWVWDPALDPKTGAGRNRQRGLMRCVTTGEQSTGERRGLG